MFNAIVEEHKYEFTGEMERKQALISMEFIKSKIRRSQSKNGQPKSPNWRICQCTEYFIF